MDSDYPSPLDQSAEPPEPPQVPEEPATPPPEAESLVPPPREPPTTAIGAAAEPRPPLRPGQSDQWRQDWRPPAALGRMVDRLLDRVDAAADQVAVGLGIRPRE